MAQRHKPVPVRRVQPGPAKPAPGRPVPVRRVPVYEPPKPPEAAPLGPSPTWEQYKALLLSGGAVPLKVIFRLRPREVDLVF